MLTEFKKGSWQEVSITMADLDFELLRGEGPVLPEVYEIRLALEYEEGRNNIEMWLDNFGWE